LKQRLLLLVPTATYRARAFLDAAQRLDIDITIASEEPSSLAEFHPSGLLTLDFDDPPACACDIAAFAREHPIHAVVGVDDQVTVAAAAIGQALALPHNPIAAAGATRNKHLLRKALAAGGVPSPGFRVLALDSDATQVAADVAYPCVLKPLMMAASRGVVRANNPTEFVKAFENIRKIVAMPDAPQGEESRTSLLVETYVPGWEVAVEGIVTDGELHVFTIFDKPDPLEGPYFAETIYVSPSRLPAAAQQRIIATTQAGITALGLQHGPIHAELRGEGDALWLIEIAARSIGGYCSKVLRFQGGLSLEDVIVRHALRMNDGHIPLEPGATGVMMLQAPRPGRFSGVEGADSARAVPGIDEFVLSAWVGQQLSPLPEGFLYVGFIFARAGTPEAVEEALRQAHSNLNFLID
jgi:biotin carboxylase